MQISEINMLMPMKVVIDDGDSKESLIVFYDSESGSIHYLNDLDDKKKSLIKDSVKQHFVNELNDVDFSMPEYLLETINHAENENHEFFGLTKELKESKTQETENKEGENV
jgi:hypothetical protein